MNKKRLFHSVIFIFLFFSVNAAAQNYVFSSSEAQSKNSIGVRSANAGFAEQEFRRGVYSYYRGNYNDAIMEFEKALSYLPSENIILDWLGKSYYKSGLEGSALDNWKLAAENGYGGLLLQNKIEIVRERRINDNSYDSPVKYTECGAYPGINGENLVFSQPVGILPESDGSVWVISYGTNQLLRMDVNGFVFERKNGSPAGFDRPMDIIRAKSGDLLITEFAGDRISVFDKKGNYKSFFGSKGTGVGNVIGPQYLASDEFGNIYVSDFGNGRVDVFDSDGKGLFYFGNFKAPSGIAVVDSSVYVADSVTGGVYEFDTAGNFLGFLCQEKTFVHPEAMKIWGKYLILCDRNKIYSIDIASGAVFENSTSGNGPSKLTAAVPDVNGNLLASDFETNEIYVMAKLSELVGGLFVQIENVNADNFPSVVLEVKVENRHRQSVVGLKEKNFIVTENKARVKDLKFLGASYANEKADITILVDRSLESKQYFQHIESAIQEIALSMNGQGTLRLVSVGEIPVLEYEGSPQNLEKFSINSLRNPLSSSCQLDVAIRLAANGLINGEKKRGIIYTGTGNAGSHSFSKYGLTDISAYLNNNSIIFSSVLVNESRPSKEISFIFSHTNGKQYYVYRTSGLSNVVQDIIDMPSGIYQFSYTSSLSTSFGQKYLGVEVEAYLLNRSGRDDSGYFAPLQ